MRILLLAVLLCACDSGPDGPSQSPDAPVAIDAPPPPMDAPYACMPVAPRAPADACLALDPAALRGGTPFGNLDVALDYFGAGDCITISQAHIHWTGACGEELALAFPYPVVTGIAGREVTHSFDTDARFDFQPPQMAPHDDTTTIHVEVVKWKEGQAGVHDIDITVSITDPLYTVAPVRVHGTFCDWPYYVC